MGVATIEATDFAIILYLVVDVYMSTGKHALDSPILISQGSAFIVHAMRSIPFICACMAISTGGPANAHKYDYTLSVYACRMCLI